LLFIPISTVFDCEERPPVLPHEKRGVAVGLKFSEGRGSVCGEVKEAETLHVHAENVGLHLNSFASDESQDLSRHYYDP
jgi:hypothetical protein